MRRLILLILAALALAACADSPPPGPTATHQPPPAIQTGPTAGQKALAQIEATRQARNIIRNTVEAKSRNITTPSAPSSIPITKDHSYRILSDLYDCLHESGRLHDIILGSADSEIRPKMESLLQDRQTFVTTMWLGSQQDPSASDKFLNLQTLTSLACSTDQDITH